MALPTPLKNKTVTYKNKPYDLYKGPRGGYYIKVDGVFKYIVKDAKKPETTIIEFRKTPDKQGLKLMGLLTLIPTADKMKIWLDHKDTIMKQINKYDKIRTRSDKLLIDIQKDKLVFTIGGMMLYSGRGGGPVFNKIAFYDYEDKLNDIMDMIDASVNIPNCSFADEYANLFDDLSKKSIECKLCLKYNDEMHHDYVQVKKDILSIDLIKTKKRLFKKVTSMVVESDCITFVGELSMDETRISSIEQIGDLLYSKYV